MLTQRPPARTLTQPNSLLHEICDSDSPAVAFEGGSDGEPMHESARQNGEKTPRREGETRRTSKERETCEKESERDERESGWQISDQPLIGARHCE